MATNLEDPSAGGIVPLFVLKCQCGVSWKFQGYLLALHDPFFWEIENNNLPTEAFLVCKSSLFLWGVLMQERAFSILLTMLWQQMQSFTDKSHSIQIYQRDYRRLGCYNLRAPAS